MIQDGAVAAPGGALGALGAESWRGVELRCPSPSAPRSASLSWRPTRAGPAHRRSCRRPAARSPRSLASWYCLIDAIKRPVIVRAPQATIRGSISFNATPGTRRWPSGAWRRGPRYMPAGLAQHHLQILAPLDTDAVADVADEIREGRWLPLTSALLRRDAVKGEIGVGPQHDAEAANDAEGEDELAGDGEIA